MEHKAIQWLGAPCCQRGSYAFYKSVSSRSDPEGPVQVWRLGEFYCVRCGPQDPVCIAEVTLLWEEQARRHLLASTRLYFLPEDTPKGRTREHGEDEVLAVSRKMVVRVEDLVQWLCATPAGGGSVKPAPCGTNGLHKPLQSNDNVSNAINRSSEPPRDRRDLLAANGIKVLSYPQYCRFRSLQRRVQDRARGPVLQDPHLLALGGVKALPNIRLMYCRDTFNHPTLESSSSFSWQFRCPSLSLRGRPRKRRSRDGKDSPVSSQSESWIDRMKENVMGSVEAGCEGSWLPHPEEQLFLDQLFAFMEGQGAPIHKVPNLGFKKIDLFLMYSVVKRLGGYKQVTLDRLWKVVYNELGGCPGSTSAATCTRRHYERLMLPYEEHLRAGGAEFKIPESPLAPKDRGIRGRKPLPRGRKPGTKGKEKIGAGAPPPTPSILPLTPDLSPLSTPLLPFQPRGAELKLDPVTSMTSVTSAPTVLLPALPRHFVGGALGGFSPVKGVCPLDVFRSRVGLQRSLESPAVTPQDPSQRHPTVYALQPKGGSPDTPRPSGEHPQLHQQHRCSGCSADEGAPRGGCRDARSRPPLPPLRVLPLNLDCSVQVCQLMRTRLGSSQLQTFTRRLSEALSQDLGPKTPPCPITPPPEQALPLNLSKRFTKRHGAEGPDPGPTEEPPPKRPRSPEQILDQNQSDPPGSGGTRAEPEQTLEGRNQEEPADLSSPSRIRAFLLGLPPFQVKFEEDLNGSRLGRFLPPGPRAEPQRPEKEEPVKLDQSKTETGQREETDPTLLPGPAPGPAELQNTDTHCF
ncbi:AT-rich interactive domain-containing protein 5B isoform X2 [Antennarius striatus]|uniref:AT-rich interactive domain-containing protein 5B isoform X2 n=1 Tax=Antennarius striatus TaxID=241820 RepID=UPI0035AE8184